MRVNGFTLIELLVALVAGSLLMVSLSWSLSILTRQLAVSKEEERAEKLAAVVPILTDLIEGAQPPGRDRSRFQGDADRLVALVSPPRAAGPVGPLRMTLAVRSDAEGEGLYASFIPTEADSDFPDAARQERPLFEGYKDIHFTYMAPLESRIPRLPRLITLNLMDDEDHVTRIAIEPHIDSDGSCHFDPISMTCRY